MKNIKTSTLALLVAGMAVAAVLLSQSQTNASQEIQIDPAAPAPAWQLQDLDGKTVHSSDFKGKVILLDFWATWCPPCRGEIPGFVELEKKYHGEGLAVIGISMDQSSAAEVKAFTKSMGMNYPVMVGDTKISAAYGGITGLPTTFIIDRSGRPVKQHLGYTEKAEFEQELLPLLKDKKTAQVDVPAPRT